MSHWSDEEGETARGDQARAVIREPRGKEATRSADLSVYDTRRGVNIDTNVRQNGGTHDKQDGNRVFATNSDEVWRVCVVAGTNDVDESAMVMSEVHHHLLGRAWRAGRISESTLRVFGWASSSYSISQGYLTHDELQA